MSKAINSERSSPTYKGKIEKRHPIDIKVGIIFTLPDT